VAVDDADGGEAAMSKNQLSQGFFYLACFLIAIMPLLALLWFYAGLHRWFW
jgi:hypothetical protein